MSDARLVNLVGTLVVALAGRVREATEAASGQPAGGPAALVALHERGHGSSIDELRGIVGLSPSGAVRLVDRLAAAGLVARRPGRDSRTLSVELTPRGHNAAQRVLDARAAAVTTALDALSRSQKAQLTSIVEVLITAITEQRLAARHGGGEPSDGWLCRLCDFEACGRPVGACPAALTGRSRAPGAG
jgi:DNA-binding MarR family transcriptional regulator